ncbi:MAG: hypothetical protein MPJ22_09025, partial [Pirellulales bacterium]|nr:hypothetical protein [Pirellulales bacterium]
LAGFLVAHGGIDSTILVPRCPDTAAAPPPFCRHSPAVAPAFPVSPLTGIRKPLLFGIAGFADVAQTKSVILRIVLTANEVSVQIYARQRSRPAAHEAVQYEVSLV